MEEKRVSKFVYWTPRIWGIFFVCFLALFSLDVFEPGLSAGQIALGLFMHNIPSLVLLAVILISWKREIVGGIVFILGGILYIVIMSRDRFFDWGTVVAILIISGQAFLVGTLFIINWLKKRKDSITPAN